MAYLSSKAVGTLIRVQESGANVNYEIAGFNTHGAGLATLVRKDLRGTSAFGGNTNYIGSTLDTLCNTTIFATFPEELKRIIQEVTLTLATTSTTSTTIQRKCFALSYTEVGFENNGSIAENTALSRYNSNANRIKTNGNSAAHWGLRSLYVSDPSIVRLVYSDGTARYGDPSITVGVAPAFVLRSDVIISDTANADGSFNIMYASKIDVKIKAAEYSDRSEAVRVLLRHNGVLNTLQVCNNFNDASPTWEAATKGEEHEFTNNTKTAAKWAVAIRVDVRRTGAEKIYIDEPVVMVR